MPGLISRLAASHGTTLAPIICVLLLVLSAGILLNTAAPNEEVRPMSLARESGWQTVAIDLIADRRAEGKNVLWLLFDLGDINQALSADRIELAMATYDADVVLETARLDILGTQCTFEVSPGAVLENNSYLTFLRGTRCPDSAPRGPARLQLNVSTLGPAFVAVWGVVPLNRENATDQSLIAVVTPAGPRVGQAWARGRFVKERSGDAATYGQLLAFLWDDPLPVPVWMILAAAVTALLGGTALMSLVRIPQWHIVGAGLVSAGLGTAYAVLLPPLHGPDEPVHLAAFAGVAERPELMEQFKALAARDHFERLRTRSDERFRPANREQPSGEEMQAPSPAIEGGAVWSRSPVTGLYWKAAAPLMENWRAVQVLLGLRLLNVAIFAIAVSAATALVAAVPSGRQIYAPLLLTVPTLAAFGMYVSNYSLVVAAYIVSGAILVRVFASVPMSLVTGATLGCLVGAAAYLSRSGIPMVLVWAPMFLARLRPSVLADRPTTMQSLLFWLGSTAPIAAFAGLTMPLYRTTFEILLLELGYRKTVSPAHPMAVVAIAGLLAFALERVTLAIVPRVGTRSRVVVRGLVMLAGATVVGGTMALLLAAHFIPQVALPFYASVSTSALRGWYVTEVWAAAVGLFGAYPPDFLLVATFWGGFGWLETMPPLWLISLLSGALGVLFLAYVIAALRNERIDRIAMSVVLVAALAAGLSAYAFTAAWGGTFLHGRYLIGWYVALFAPAAAFVMEWGSRHSSVHAGVWGIFSAVHAICIAAILGRYFGP